MRLVGWVVVAFVLATSLGCDVNFKAGSFEEDKKAALVALDIFHRRLNDAQFEAIYENASDFLRAQPKEQLLAAMRQTHEQWGKLISSRVISSSCFPNEVRFLVEAQFQRGLASEMVVWRVPNKEAHLEHFEIFPGSVRAPRRPISGGIPGMATLIIVALRGCARCVITPNRLFKALGTAPTSVSTSVTHVPG